MSTRISASLLYMVSGLTEFRRTTVIAYENRTVLDFGRGAIIELIDSDEAARRGEAQPARGPAYMASATFAVKSIESLKTLLSANGVDFELEGRRMAIDPAHAAGSRLHFEQR